MTWSEFALPEAFETFGFGREKTQGRSPGYPKTPHEKRTKITPICEAKSFQSNHMVLSIWYVSIHGRTYKSLHSFSWGV